MVHCENNFDSVRAVFLEPVVNHLASNYIAKNWDRLLRTIEKWGFSNDIAKDLLQDVFEVTLKKEERGEGFDINVFENIDTSDPNYENKAVGLHILGRLSDTSKNPRYYSTGQYRPSSNKQYRFTTEAASASTDEEGQMSSTQWAYQNASQSEEESDFDEILSLVELRDDIRYCIKYAPHSINMLFFFRRLEEISKNLKEIEAKGGKPSGKTGSRTSRRQSTGLSVFEPLLAASNKDPQFKEAFISSMTASERDRNGFLRLLDEIENEMNAAETNSLK